MDWFFAPTRGRNDAVNAGDIANTNARSYMNSRPDVGCSGTMNPASSAAESVGLIPTAGYGMAAGGCTVDLNTDLLWGIDGARRVKGPKQLWPRPFVTTPNLNGGNPNDVDHESQLIQSASIRNRKETNTISDKTIPHYFAPLIDDRAEEIKDTDNWIEPWVKGGESTRLIPMKRVSSQ
jgi:hypothetical protein